MVVCVPGTVCDFRLSYGRVLNRRSKIIAVNRDKTQLLKNSDMFWKPNVAIQGWYCCLNSPISLICFHKTLPLPVWLFDLVETKISVCLLGDAGSFLLRLSKGLKGHTCPEDWPQSLKAGDVTKEKANRYTCGIHSASWAESQHFFFFCIPNQ